MNSKKIFLLSSCLGIAAVLLTVAGALSWRYIRLNESSLKKVLGSEPRVLGLMIVDDLSVPLRRLRIFRISDKKEQVVTGTFSYQFTSPDEAIIFGSPENNFSKQVLFLINPISARLVDISRLPGPIYQILPSPNFRYYLIQGLTNSQKPYTCVLAKSMTTTERCIFLEEKIKNLAGATSSSAAFAFWNSDRQAELIIPLTTTSQAILHPSEQKLLTTSTLIQPKQRGQEVPYTIKRWSSIARVTPRQGKNIWLHIPTSWALLQLDNGFLLGVDTKQSYLINPLEHTFTPFVHLPPQTQRIIAVP